MLLLVAGGALLDRAGFSYAHMLMLLCFFLWMTWLAARPGVIYRFDYQ